MAVIVSKSSAAVNLRTKTGVNAAGDDIIATQKISKIKVTAADQDIFDVATSIGTLLQYPMTGVAKTEESQIVSA